MTIKKLSIIVAAFIIGIVIINMYQTEDYQFETINSDSAKSYLNKLAATSNIVKTSTGNYELDSYEDYLKKHEAAVLIQDEVQVNILNYETNDMDVQINTDVIDTDETGTITWKVQIEQAGFYNILVKYYPLEGTSSSIERKVYINGRIPFEGAHLVSFSRVWVNEGEIELINKGEVRPEKIESPEWREEYISDSRTFIMGAYQFYFNEGENQVSFESVREPMRIGSITLKQEPNLKSYEAYYADLKDDYSIYEGDSIIYQAEREEENLTTKIKTSSPMLYGIANYTDPKAMPFHPYYTRLNLFGGKNWRVLGDWVEWEIKVPKEGLYNLTYRANQNANRGLFSSRELKINGKTPFSEAKKLTFTYSSDLNLYTLGNNAQNYLFHFKEGINTISMRVVYGDLGPIVKDVEDSVKVLNDLYRQVIQYTGVNPDTYIDYQLTLKIPGIKTYFSNEATRLEGVIDDIIKLSGSKGQDAATIEKMVILLKDLAKDPESVVDKLTLFSSNVTSLGSWLLSVSEQSLNIDYFVLHGEHSKLPDNNTNFFLRIWYGILRFFSTFFIDLNTLSGSNENEIKETITVWTPSSRDQAQIIRELIDNTFTKETGIAVNLQLIPKEVLLPATIAGKSPDVVIQIGQDMLDGANVGSNGLPINFAMRHASVDVSQYEGFSELKTQFYDSAFTPVSFNGGVYGVPETQDFQMLFYRKDILRKLNLEIPETWDDVYNMIATLQINNYDFYIAPSIQTYSTLLYQKGGDLYKGEGLNYGIESGLKEEVAVDAFEQYTAFYSNYSFDISANFVNRFRSGEMPIGIANYISVYNTLSVFAPEIRGEWGMAPVPGTKNPDGTVNNISISDGLYSIMLNNSKKKEASWEFMKWWVDKNTQVDYGRKLEGVLGAAGRYSTANKYALAELGWPQEELNQLQIALKSVVGYPEVPGGYMTIRQVNYAFYAVINDGLEPREALYLYLPDINREITKKRKEFGLTVQ